jgi:hypothetical protein
MRKTRSTCSASRARSSAAYFRVPWIAPTNPKHLVDIPSMKEVAKVAVGQVPKRNYTMVIPAGRLGTQ